MVTRTLLMIALVAVLAGCATSERAREPPVAVPASTWRQVDRDLLAASQVASEQAADYAHDAMQHWMDLVYQRTDSDFIPWYSSYWTRQWLSMRVAWYKLNAGGEKDPTVERLALYLQKQYQNRVLKPVAKETDPDQIMEQTTRLYVRRLAERVQDIPPRYALPVEQFEHHLQGIPAIALASPPGHSASLDQLVRTNPPDQLPAFVALVEQIQHAPGGTRAWSADAGISSMAKRTSERLVTELTTSGVASALSSMAGRAAGMAISLAAAGFSAIVRENERPNMETQLRKNLNDAFDEEWLDWMRNPASGVMAGVQHIAGRLAASLADNTRPPPAAEPPRSFPVLDGQPLQFRNSQDVIPDQLW